MKKYRRNHTHIDIVDCCTYRERWVVCNFLWIRLRKWFISRCQMNIRLIQYFRCEQAPRIETFESILKWALTTEILRSNGRFYATRGQREDEKQKKNTDYCKNSFECSIFDVANFFPSLHLSIYSKAVFLFFFYLCPALSLLSHVCISVNAKLMINILKWKALD